MEGFKVKENQRPEAATGMATTYLSAAAAAAAAANYHHYEQDSAASATAAAVAMNLVNSNPHSAAAAAAAAAGNYGAVSRADMHEMMKNVSYQAGRISMHSPGVTDKGLTNRNGQNDILV